MKQLIQGKLPIVTKTNYAFPQSPSPIYEQGVNGQHILNDMMGNIIQKGTKPADAVKDAHDRLVAAASPTRPAAVTKQAATTEGSGRCARSPLLSRKRAIVIAAR